MSRVIPTDEPLSPENRKYLEDRGNYSTIRAIDTEHGGPAAVEPDSEDGLLEQIGDLEAQLTDLRGRHTQLRIAREQQEAGVRDNTVVNGEGGQEDDEDWYEDEGTTKADLEKEINARNADRDPADRIQVNGTKAQLVERLRADDDDEDDEEDEG